MMFSLVRSKTFTSLPLTLPLCYILFFLCIGWCASCFRHYIITRISNRLSKTLAHFTSQVWTLLLFLVGILTKDFLAADFCWIRQYCKFAFVWDVWIKYGFILPAVSSPPGPQDHGWCSGYTCQKRVSLFHSIVATHHSFDVFFSSVSPQKLRLMMLNANPADVSARACRASTRTSHFHRVWHWDFVCCLQSVLVSVFYSKPQQLNVYVDDNLIVPTNALWNADNTDYTLKRPVFAGTHDHHINKCYWMAL